MGRIATLLSLMLAGCAGSEATPPLLEARVGRDLPADHAGPGVDGAPARDLVLDRSPDHRKPDSTSCALGTPDHCGGCGKACPPGQDPGGAIRVCLGSSCEIQCLEESYDVDGSVNNGCEVQDDLPIHDLAQTARDLGSVADCDNPVQATAILPSDARTHLKSPNDRANGRPDWFRLHIQDTFGCVVDAKVTVSLAGFPAAVSIRGTAYWLCDGGSQLASGTQTGAGGGTLTLSPSTGCTFMGNDSGTLFLEVRKLSGPHTAQSYTVQIEP